LWNSSPFGGVLDALVCWFWQAREAILPCYMCLAFSAYTDGVISFDHKISTRLNHLAVYIFAPDRLGNPSNILH